MTYESAIALIEGRYGEESQLIQTAEECAELAKAAIKRYRVLAAQDPSSESLAASRAALIEEIADVLIMIDQIVYIEDFENDVWKMVDHKIERQLERIRGNEHDTKTNLA